MHSEDHHITDSELLLDLDGQLSADRATAVRAHLTGCWKCRARKGALESAIADFVDVYHGRPAVEVPSMEGPRALLRARLAEIAASSTERKTGLDPLLRKQIILVGLVVLFVTIGTLLLPFQRSRQPDYALMPDALLTPGATVPIKLSEVCAAPAIDDTRVVTASVARQVFDKYGIRNPRPRTYEVDYLITPALGGADDISNLWPQRYSEGAWNSRVKDALEDRLRELVCSGQIDLATAQREIARDWIGAYKKYFRTTTPVISHLSFNKDRPWE